MRNFCVSYIDWSNNNLEMRTVSAADEVAAIKIGFLDKYSGYNFDGCSTVEEVKCEAFNMDSMLGVLEIGRILPFKDTEGS